MIRQTPPEPVLRIEGITKSFGDNRVLRGVGFAVDEGAVYGLMGANGAGKSTLIKILSGAHAPDGGEIRLRGRAVRFPDPVAAQRAGVATVHQDPNDGVVLDMTVAENLALDRLTAPGGPVGFRHRRIERYAREVAEGLGMRLGRQVLRSPVRRLGVSERQLLVLARALARRPEILILDEPTSALSAEETTRLFDLVAALVADGTTVLFVSHKLAEFDRLCRHVGVLRDGAMRGEFFREGSGDGSGDSSGDDDEGAAFDWPRVLTALFDRSPAEMRHAGAAAGPAVLALRGVQLSADAPPFDLDLHAGQVTVLLGLLGSGKTELLEWVFGARAAPAGRRELGGEPFTPTHPADAVARGVYLLAESRHEQAIIPGWPVSAQMTLPFLRRFSSATLVRAPAERRAAAEMMAGIGVIARGPRSPIETLSGGNQQKVMIGRWLLGSPRVLLLDEPFRGVDINARHDIGATVRTLTGTAAVLVATSDLDEALEVGDRIVVLNHGRPTADLALADVTRDRLIRAMSTAPPAAVSTAPPAAGPTDGKEQDGGG